MAALSAWFWDERFWLPRNVTWADLADPPAGVEYPTARHLFSVLPLALLISVMRILFERYIAGNCARSLHIQAEISRRAQPNAVLEKVYRSIAKNPDSRHMDGLSKQLDWQVRKVQRWFRHRRNQDKPSTHTKFCESMWRLTFYLCIFTYGIRFLWQDFVVMFVHHLATVGLISFSYANNMLRVGSLAAKLANYAKYQRLCDFLFILFSVAFFITRLVLHVVWSYLIARIALKAVLRGKVCKDVRSDIESSSEEEADVSRAGATTRAAPISSTRASPGTLLSPKGENGTNGHCTCSKDIGASTEPQQRL
ncbi:hypothetical protein CRUP_023856 [Coryphaenoides rupestris]|nr:hypothetical protein CRUP_023856 [Coryphaenoides rupestris]